MGLGGWLRQAATAAERMLAVTGGLLLFYATTLTDIVGAALFLVAIAVHLAKPVPQEIDDARK